MIAGAALSIVLALRIFLKKRKQQEEQSGKKRWIYKLIGILAGIALVVLFLATQDMSCLLYTSPPSGGIDCLHAADHIAFL